MKSNFLWKALVAAFAVVLCCSYAQAQTVTGTITGTITDPSGAVVPGAQVVAHNVGTGVDSPAKTNSTGFYRIEFLPIGRYSVSVTANGFGTATVPEFQLEVLQTATFNVALTVGGGDTTVEVSTAAPILNTNDASLGGPSELRT